MPWIGLAQRQRRRMSTASMKACIIVNPHAGSAEQFAQLEAVLASWKELDYWTSEHAGHGIELARRACREGYELVAAAGGDGTINEVLNGIMEAGGGVRFGVVPLGTGNDLARTLAIPDDPRDAVALLKLCHVVPLDVMQVESDEKTLYGINAAAGGFSGQVDEAISEELKAQWGALAYVIGAASVLPELQDFETCVAFDDGPLETVDALSVVVANGRTVAGGKRVAPLANPEDGLLDVVMLKTVTALDLAAIGTRLLAGTYLESPHVVHRRARRLYVESKPGMLFNVDGELFTRKPVTFTVLPGAVEVVIGTDYCADIEAELRAEQVAGSKDEAA